MSFSFVMVLRLCAGIRFCIKVLILDYSGGFLQPNMHEQLDVFKVDVDSFKGHLLPL